MSLVFLSPPNPSSSSTTVSLPLSPAFDMCKPVSVATEAPLSSSSGSTVCRSDDDGWAKPKAESTDRSSSSNSTSWSSTTRETPPSSVSSPRSTSKATPLSPITRPKPRRTIVPLPLDPSLQAYYFRMRRASTRTLHPSHITREARCLVGRIAKGTLDVRGAAQLLFYAGISRIETCRSASLLAQDTATELLWRTNWATRDGLVRELERVVYASFVSVWADDFDLAPINAGNGVSPLRPLLEESRAQFLNIAAFLGALAACDLISSPVLHLAVAALTQHPRSIAHCRALHLLLLYANTSVSERVLVGCTDILALHAAETTLFVHDPMARRWLLEICALAEENLKKKETAGKRGVRVASLKWDPYLKCKSLLGLSD